MVGISEISPLNPVLPVRRDERREKENPPREDQQAPRPGQNEDTEGERHVDEYI